MNMIKGISLLLLISLLGCSQSKSNFVKGAKIEREFELLITEPNGNESFLLVYANFDIQNKIANFYGVSSFNTKVFTLKVLEDHFILKQHLNNELSKGQISEFKMIPLSEKIVFEELPYIDNKKILKDKQGNIIQISPIYSFY